MEQSENNNFSDILSAFNVINTSLAFSVYLPIAKRTVRFKQLTTGQEKRIAKQLLVGDNDTIYTIMPEILQENCINEDFSVKEASIIDFFCIILQTRIYSIGNQITIRTLKQNSIDKNTEDNIKSAIENIPTADVQNQNDEQGKKSTKKNELIDIKLEVTKIYDAIVNATKDYSDIRVSLKDCPYQIVCGIPSVKTIQNTLDGVNDEDIITRLAKFIKEIYLVNVTTGEEKLIKLVDFSADQIKDVIEIIPNRLLVEASEKIIDFFKLLTTVQLYKFKVGGTEYKQTINFTSLNFFTSF